MTKELTSKQKARLVYEAMNPRPRCSKRRAGSMQYGVPRRHCKNMASWFVAARVNKARRDTGHRCTFHVNKLLKSVPREKL